MDRVYRDVAGNFCLGVKSMQHISSMLKH